jgi:hypothetical protein
MFSEGVDVRAFLKENMRILNYFYISARGILSVEVLSAATSMAQMAHRRRKLGHLLHKRPMDGCHT